MKERWYVALLRGINLGKRQVKMDVLKKAFEAMGFNGVQTLFASGNVVFGTKKADVRILAQEIEVTLQKTFGFPIHVIVRSIEEIQHLAHVEPFKHIAITSNTRLYVTFFSHPPAQKSIQSGDGFQILRITDTEVCSILTLSQGRRKCGSYEYLGERIWKEHYHTQLEYSEKDMSSENGCLVQWFYHEEYAAHLPVNGIPQ